MLHLEQQRQPATPNYFTMIYRHEWGAQMFERQEISHFHFCQILNIFLWGSNLCFIVMTSICFWSTTHALQLFLVDCVIIRENRFWLFSVWFSYKVSAYLPVKSPAFENTQSLSCYFHCWQTSWTEFSCAFFGRQGLQIFCYPSLQVLLRYEFRFRYSDLRDHFVWRQFLPYSFWMVKRLVEANVEAVLEREKKSC